jgi:16S rRNA C967 or C1407 C5-methylase (RsmB/RsmF family)
MDFLTVDPENVLYDNVKFILLDPSCSGSGMKNHIFTDRIKAVSTEANFYEI